VGLTIHHRNPIKSERIVFVVKPKKCVPLNLDLVISSFGGAGTTLLINFFNNYFRTNSYRDYDRLKHLPYPPLSFKKNQKFIYLFGDPVHATISLFRRNFHRSQSKKILDGLRIKQQPLPTVITLEEYASQGVDRFYLRDHFMNWYRSSHSHPILFIRYETLYQNLDTLFEFLNLPEDLVSTFPPYKERQSYNHELPEDTLSKLHEMHHDFIEELKLMPDVKINHPLPVKFQKRVENISSYSFSMVYWNIHRVMLSIHLRLRSDNNDPEKRTIQQIS
jgi:hypothetical protein